jgi:raffinose/stachyose/melibiose transport system permease protein
VKHAILIFSAAAALFPVLIIVMNSVKERLAIFNHPYALPTAETWDIIGYTTVFLRSDFVLYYKNSLIVIVCALFLILLLGSLVSYALTEYRFRGNNVLFIYFILGIMIPIRLGSVGVLKIMTALKLTNTLWALILIYAVAGMPLAIFILTQFFRQIPSTLKEAARIDGASEFHIYLMCVKLIRPAIASVAALSVSPIWNDIWWPLILASTKDVMTVTLGAQQFLGQFSTNWNALLAALSMAMIPLVILYVLFSKYVMSGMIEGAVKG